MNRTVVIAYPSAADELEVLYSIEQTDDVQTINCSVQCKSFPLWLQLRKFAISSVLQQGSYTTLFSALNSSKNMDTTLFIDLVYSCIMNVEKRRYS